MIGFFRRSLTNWMSLAILGIVLIAFVVTGAVTREMNGGGSVAADAVASVGGKSLTTADAAKRIQTAMQAARQENPQIDTASFVAQGGVESVIDQILADRALEMWGRKQGIAANEAVIGGEMGSIAAFRDPTGKFDPQIMRALLAQKGISEREFRDDVAGQAITRQLLVPASGGTRVPVSLVAPYAALLLEEREGLVGAVPVDSIPAGAAPGEAEIAAYYKANVARYTIPERRVLRYAAFGAAQARPPAAPTAAQIAAFYAANAKTYAAKETRDLLQVILPDQAGASAFAAKVKAGTAFEAAARAAGFAPADTKVGEMSQAQYAAKASDAAAAAFAAPSGGIAGPAKGDLGWYVVKVVSVTGTPARPLAAVRDEIANALVKQAADQALADMVAAVDDAIGGGSSFDEVVKSEKLAVTVTPPLLPDGTAPDDPAWRPAPEMAVLMKAAQGMSADDDPTVETIGAGQLYALVSVAKVVPAAPAPLARIHDRIAADMVAQRRAEAARRIADGVIAAVKRGTPLPAALAAAKMPPARPAKARQIDLSQQRQVPPPLALMFTMRQGDIKLLAAPQNAGWYIVQLAKVTPGDARTRPDLIEATRAQFVKLVGQEYAEQLQKAAQKAIGVKRDAAAIAKLKAGLAGNGASQ